MSKHFLQPLATASLLSALSLQSAQAQNSSPYWSVAGNNNATASTSKLGTTNGYPLRLTTNNATRLYITPTGNVGIGTTTPAQRLHVEGTSNQGIFVGTSALGTTSGSGMIGYVKATPTASGQRLGYYHLGSRGGAQNNYNAVGMSGYAGGAWSSTSRPAYLTFETTPSGAVNKVERMRIDPNGNVGIGVTNPELPLDVAGRIRLRSAGGGTAGLWLNNMANSGAIGFVGAANDNQIGLWGNDGGQWGLLMNTATGDVVIGNAPSAAKLGVKARSQAVYAVAENSSGSATGVSAWGYGAGTGTVYGVFASGSGGTRTYGIYSQTITNGSSFTAAGYFNGPVWSTSYNYLTSDRKLKEEVKPLQNSLAQLLKLRPSTYRFKTEEYKSMRLPNGRQMGLVADELKEVFPELVQQAIHPAEYDKEDRTKVIAPEVTYEGVNYQGLIPVLIASIQEQQQQIKSQQAHNEALQAEVTELRQMVLDMKNGRNSPITVTSAYLEQNIPNPVTTSTTIRYSVPQTASSVRLVLTNAKGQLIKTISISNRGSGQVSLNTAALAAGTYNYTLHVDGKQADTKRLIIAK